MGRVRSRQIEAGAVNARTIAADSVKRTHIERWAVGSDEIHPGVVNHRHIGAEAVHEENVHPSLVPQEAFSFEPDQVAVVACESADYPVHRGGRPVVNARVRTAPTCDLDVALYRNGVTFGTVTIASGQLAAPQGSFDALFVPGDLARSEVTDPAADAEWLVVTWVLG